MNSDNRMAFNVDVMWEDGTRETATITDLMVGTQIFVQWKYDDSWNGVIEKTFDRTTVEVSWNNDGTKNNVSLRNLMFVNPSEFMSKPVQLITTPARFGIIVKVPEQRSLFMRKKRVPRAHKDVVLVSSAGENQGIQFNSN